MRIASVVTVSVLLTACSSAQVQPPSPGQCHKTDRHGVYRAEFDLQSGTCGPQTSALVNFDDPGTGAGCATSGTTWSDGDCKLSTSVRCNGTASAPPTEATMVSTQQTQDGSSITGTMTIQVDGSHGCLGTYGVRLTRQ